MSGRQTTDDSLGLALVSVAGLGMGLVFGMVAAELVGTVDADRVRRMVRRMRRREPSERVAATERAVLRALRGDPTTQDLDLGVRALGDGVVELVGRAPTAAARRRAGTLAQDIDGADVVVNRVLVEGADTAPPTAASG